MACFSVTFSSIIDFQQLPYELLTLVLLSAFFAIDAN